MKLINSTLIILFILVSNVHINAQYQIGLLTAIKHGKLLNTSSYNYFDSNSTFGIGIIGRKNIVSKGYLSASISYQKFGFYELNFEDSPRFDVYSKGKALHITTDIGYYIIQTQKFKLGTSLGLNIGIILDHQLRIIHSYPICIIDLYYDPKIVPAIEFNIDLIYQLTEHFSVNLRPKYYQYLHNPNREFKHRNWGLDIIALYSIK